MKSTSPRPIVVSQGDPEGVGPELIVRLAASGCFREGDRVVAAEPALRRACRAIAEPWVEQGLARLQPLLHAPASESQVEALARAVDLVLAADSRAALVTAPIDKAACRREGFDFPGHTEYLAHRAGGVEVAMLLAGPQLRVVPVTIHVALSEVPARLDVGAIVSAGRLLAQALRDLFAIAGPRIGVLGLNPHAGEGGLFGNEEQTVIGPAVARLRELSPFASFLGPLAADTAFVVHANGDLDGIVAMYHDQALAPFKLIHFHDGVNVTLGLPFVRCSPDHGTAKDIAGRGIADPRSLAAAIELARGAGGEAV